MTIVTIITCRYKVINNDYTYRLSFVGLNGTGDVLENALNLLALSLHLVNRLICCRGDTHHSGSDINDREYWFMCAKSLEESADLQVRKNKLVRS